MNRIYQGKVTDVEIQFPSSEGSGVGKSKGQPNWQPFDPEPKQAKAKWQSALWQHHQLFQDAVNSQIKETP